MILTRNDIGSILEAHETWRDNCLNLIASENRLSPTVRAALDNDLVQRYGDYVGRDGTDRKYRGNRYLQELESKVVEVAGGLFGASEVELRAISGHVAGLAVIAGLTRPGDVVLEVGSDGGGHRLAAKLAQAPLVDLTVDFLPFDSASFNVDVGRAADLIRRTQPRLVILGSSTFLFPHPVRQLAEIVAGVPGAVLAYDASHVFGLIAGHRFQDPLREGAQVVFGSTHKTLFGPQGGIILSNDRLLMNHVADALYPPIVTNHHPFRIPALGLALLELVTWGEAYASQVIANAQSLGAEIAARGLPVVRWQGTPSQSHTLILQVAGYGSAADIAARLEQANIICTPARLPAALEVEGIRIGTQEITRLGMGCDEMAVVADLVVKAVTGHAPVEQIAAETAFLRRRFQQVHFTWT